MWREKTGKEDYKPLERDWNEFNDRRGKCSKKNEWLICFSAHWGELEIVLESGKFPRGDGKLLKPENWKVVYIGNISL